MTIEALAEVLARQLYRAEGYSTMFAYCTRSLHLSLAVLESAHRKTKDQVMMMVATLRPRVDAPPVVRRLPPARLVISTTTPAAAANASETTPLSPARFRIQCTVDQDTYDSLRRLQSLMRHQLPSGDPAAILKKALAMLLANVEKTRFGIVAQPRRTARTGASADGRYIPRSIRREVSKRDGEQCAFVGRDGRCEARDRLEFHHLIPFARGGPTTADNLELRCSAHNQLQAEEDYGLTFMRGKRGRSAPDAGARR